MGSLADIRSMLPQVMVSRYQPAWWVAAANDVLGEIETRVDSPEFYVEVALALRTHATGYRLPPQIRKPCLLHALEPGAFQVDRAAPGIPFRVVGDLLRLEAPYSHDGAMNLVGNVTALSETSIEMTATQGSDHRFAGWLLELPTAHRVVVDNLGGVLALNDPVALPLPPAATGRLIKNFLILTGLKKLKRFTALADPSPLEAPWDAVLARGLRYLLEIATDETSQQAPYWRAEFLDALERFSVDSSKHRGALYTARPRPWSR